MTPRDDLDGQATSGRAVRRKSVRTRQAARLVARAGWLDGHLVYWTGKREEIPRLADALLPLRALLQDRLAELPAGPYAVRLSRPGEHRPAAGARHADTAQAAASSGGILDLEVSDVEGVTRERIAATARAIEAVSKFPQAGARLVGPVDRWRHDALTRLDRCRQAVDGADAWRSGYAGAARALGLEARALWIGSAPPASVTLPDAALAALTEPTAGATDDIARLAAVALGRRRRAAACHGRLATWAAAGSALDRWPAAGATWAATAIGPDALVALASAAPDLNDPLAAAWIDERQLDQAHLTAGELAGLARLVAAAAAVLTETDRRDHGDHAYLAGVARATLPRGFSPASALDQAGAAVYLAVTNRLRWQGAPDACGTMAAWLETCRPTIRLSQFWRDALAVVPSGGMQFDAARARSFTASLRAHGRRVAAELALADDERAAAVRALLPAVLARGAVATERVFRLDLWTMGEEALDAALGWVEATGRYPRAGNLNAVVPMPRRIFTAVEPGARDALLSIGLRAWGDEGVPAREVEYLLGVLACAASRAGASHWRIALPALVDVAVGLARRLLGHNECSDDESSERAAIISAILDACARWQRDGYPDAGRLARSLADRWTTTERVQEEWSGEDDERNALVTRLAEGRVPRVLDLLRYRSPARQFEWRAIDGWALVAAHPTAHAWISACLDRPKLTSRIVQLLERLALVARLEPGLTPKKLFRPLDLPANQKAAWPPWVAQDDATLLDEVARARHVAGLAGAMPGALQRLLDRDDTAARELAALRERAKSVGLSSAEHGRLEKLERLSEEPERWSAELSEGLRKALPKHVALAGLTALEALVRGKLEDRWQEVLGSTRPPLDDPAWDNALHMLWSLRSNRRILLRLLRHAARGDRVWMRDLAPNRRFLAALESAGLRPDEWLADWSLVVAGRSAPLAVYTATDPLEVLQMGSLFGTCLSAGKFNAHAAVAAAVETNKRVLYVKDAAGRVLGRQLLALTAAGELIGFTAYGAGSAGPEQHGAWVKLALELLALAIARASGARLMSASRLAAGLSDAEEQALMLFCRGYVDSLEPFDWWIEGLAEADPRSGDDDRTRLRTLLERPVPPDLDARDGPRWRREELGWAACRALLWLGADEPPLPREQQEALGLGDAQRALIDKTNRGT